MSVYDKIIKIIFICTFCWTTQCVDAAYYLHDGKMVKGKYLPTGSVQEHYANAKAALEAKNWSEAHRQFTIIANSFGESSLASDVHYYIAVAYTHLKDPEMANEHLNFYLETQSNPKFFEESIQLKLDIADLYKSGVKRHLFGVEKLPKLVYSRYDAIDLYDEVISTLPHSELAAQSLISKGELLHKHREYLPAIEAFKTLAKRFPRHPNAPQAYLNIAAVYLEQCGKEKNNSDLLSLAYINRRHFQEQFPRHEGLEELNLKYQKMEEIYAQGLYETAQFYQRLKKPQAARIYYQNVIHRFPHTEVASKCKKRLKELPGKIMKLG